MKTSVIYILTCLALGAAGFAQPSIQPTEGADTVKTLHLSPDGRTVLEASGQVLMRLPATQQSGPPELMGMLQDGAGIELFLRRFDEHSASVDSVFSLEIYRGRRGAQATLVHSFPMSGAFQWVRFFQPSGARAKPDVFVDVNPGSVALWSYLLSPDRQSMEQLSAASGVGRGEFLDLDRDGTYELVEWDTASSDRCDFFTRGFAGGGTGSVPEIFARTGGGYRAVWPPAREKRTTYEVDAKLADLRGDGAVELVVLQDGVAEAPTQVLAVYRLETTSFRLVAQTSLPPERIAVLLDIRDSPRGKQILVRSATPAECKVFGAKAEESGVVKAYVLRGDTLEPVQP